MFCRTRGLATALAGCLYYIFTFIATKLYYTVESTLSLPGITLFNCVCAVLGWILMYNIMPETEGRTLEDINIHFSDKSKKLTDHKMPKPRKLDVEAARDSNGMRNRPVRVDGVIDQ